MGNICVSESTPPPTEKPKLVYWNLHGRSDFCQAMMHAGNVSFDLDEATANAWPQSKEDTPFGQLPVLKHGSLIIGQGGAINRYCARLAGLYPSDITAAAVCDMYIEEMMDIYEALFKAKNASDKEAKLAAWKMLETEYLPKHYGILEKNLAKSGKPFLGGDSANAADVAFFAVNNLYSKAGLNVQDVLANYPKLKAALDGTMKLGTLENYPVRGLYFSSNPDNGAF